MTSVTVWYDGACPLCAREISLFRRLDRRGAIAFVDVSQPGSGASCPLDRQVLLARFHAQEAGGPVLSGAAAFAAMWRAIPWLRPFGLAARIPPVLWLFELLYRLFLRFRPAMQGLARSVPFPRARISPNPPGVMDSVPGKPNVMSRFRDWTLSLSSRLFVITLVAILLIEAIIFVPSLGNLRQAWLNERVEAARIAALALDAAPTRMVSEELSQSLLTSAAVLGVAEIEDEMRFQLLAPPEPINGQMRVVDLRTTPMPFSSLGALREFFAPEDEVLLLVAEGSAPGRTIEVLVPQAPMKEGVMAFAWRIAGLSLLIAFVAALVIYIMLRWSVVQPMRRVAMSVEQFSRDPGSWERRLPPTRRADEIGRAQNALAGMEEAVAEAFRQRAHLAELGSAVAKINHDLRNSLAAAQLVSDTLARSEDPRVKRAAPRLERALERAIDLATATLDYGKAAPRAPRWQTAKIAELIRNAAEEALSGEDIRLDLDVPETLETRTDPDHLHRIAANLMRNAAEAMRTAKTPAPAVHVRLDGSALVFADNGPGLPEQARENLFKPFAASTRANGTGLGLVIAHELAGALGGDLVLASTGGEGTLFRLTLPGLGDASEA